jgi:hypothetical protein
MAPQVDLMMELKMIQKGKCVYCTMGLPHPSYSQCEHRAQKESHRQEKVGTGFELQVGAGFARATA